MDFTQTKLMVACLSLSAAAILCQVQVAYAQEELAKGVFALPGGTGSVVGEMTLEEVGPLSRKMTLVYKDKATSEQVAKFDEELTQQLHILATDAQLSQLVHQHVKAAGNNGTFTTELKFPKPGLYHIYTDAVPHGHGQQVFRFDVSVGADAPTSPDVASAKADLSDTKTTLESSKDGYTVTLDISDLRAQREGVVDIRVEKNGAPAADITPYLGVAAHAVLVRAENLDYIHAHASEKNGVSTHEGHGSHKEPSSSTADAEQNLAGPMAESEHHAGAADEQKHTHGSHGTTADVAPLNHGAHHADHGVAAEADRVSPQMDLFVTPPAAGEYALWIEFMGGGKVHTLPFKLNIPAAQ